MIRIQFSRRKHPLPVDLVAHPRMRIRCFTCPGKNPAGVDSRRPAAPRPSRRGWRIRPGATRSDAPLHRGTLYAARGGRRKPHHRLQRLYHREFVHTFFQSAALWNAARWAQAVLRRIARSCATSRARLPCRHKRTRSSGLGCRSSERSIGPPGCGGPPPERGVDTQTEPEVDHMGRATIFARSCRENW